MPAPLNEVGKTGLLEFAGQITETYTSKLNWPGAYDVYDEMRRRDPTIRTLWNALVMLMRTAQWYFEPESDRPEDRAAAEFLDDCLNDMSHTPTDGIEDAMTCVLFGWSWLELVYKRREDGAIGWRKWAPRRQSSFDHWAFDEAGGVQAMIQRPAPTYGEIEIPIEKSLHFTFQRDGNNPEGQALLESLYESWYYLKNLQIISGIGWQRSFVGLPVFEFEEKPAAEDRAAVETVGQALSVDAKQYVSVPSGVSFRLESVANSNADALLSTIQYYRLLMLQTVLADFINLGTGQTGSWALGSDKSQLFLMATDGTLDRLADVVNRFGVARLMEYNPQIAGRARLTHTKVEKPALGQLGNWLNQVENLLTWTPEDENWIRKRTGMPSIVPGAVGDDDGPEQEDEDVDEGEDDDVGVDEGEELAEFQAYDGRDGERGEVEGKMARELRKFLNEQLDRVMERAAIDPNVSENDSFWSAEADRMRQAYMAQIARALNDLATMAVEDVTARAGRGADWTTVNADALEWAREHAGDLIANVTETTRNQVRQAVAAWIETGQELDALTAALAPTFGPVRADMIATTEVTSAFDRANDIARQELGLPAAQKLAPAHVRCRCTTREEYIRETGEWVVVWFTVRDDRVCRRPLDTPWGVVNGCRELHGMVVSENYGGQYLKDVRGG